MTNKKREYNTFFIRDKIAEPKRPIGDYISLYAGMTDSRYEQIDRGNCSIEERFINAIKYILSVINCDYFSFNKVHNAIHLKVYTTATKYRLFMDIVDKYAWQPGVCVYDCQIKYFLDI